MSDELSQVELPRACRARLHQEGSHSPDARRLFHQFYDAWYRPVYGWACAKTLIGMADAEDLVVATFWKAWQWIGGQANLPPAPLLLRVCLDRAYIDHLRAEYGRVPGGGKPSSEAGPAPQQPLSLDRVIAETPALIASLAGNQDVEAMIVDQESLREHLAVLPGAVRACVQCRHLQGWSVAETARYLELTPDQVKKYTAYGLARLAHQLIKVESL